MIALDTHLHVSESAVRLGSGAITSKIKEKKLATGYHRNALTWELKSLQHNSFESLTPRIT